MSARREYENWDQPSVFNSTLNEMFYGDLRGPNTYGYDDLMLQSNVSCTWVWMAPVVSHSVIT